MTPHEETEKLIGLLESTFKTRIVDVIRSRSAYGASYKSRRTIYFTDRIASKAERIKNAENDVLSKVASGSIGEQLFFALYKSVVEELSDIVVYALMGLARITVLERASGSEAIDHFMDYYDHPKEQ